MIVRIRGILSDIQGESVIIDREGLAYEVLVCGYALGELRANLGQSVTLHTMEYYEASSMGGNLTPRLVGFLHPEDRAFFLRIITVKGLGVRKAVKALVQPTARVAAAIEGADARQLAQLPGIGKRVADQMIAELKGKVSAFVVGGGEDEDSRPAEAQALNSDQRDALEVMVALGEKRIEAERWLERARQRHPDTQGAQEWVRLAYRIRTGVED